MKEIGGRKKASRSKDSEWRSTQDPCVPCVRTCANKVIKAFKKYKVNVRIKKNPSTVKQISNDQAEKSSILHLKHSTISIIYIPLVSFCKYQNPNLR
jgi:hypothetical protein